MFIDFGVETPSDRNGWGSHFIWMVPINYSHTLFGWSPKDYSRTIWMVPYRLSTDYKQTVETLLTTIG